MTSILVTASVLITAWTAWSLYCNEICYRQRLRIIECLNGERALYDAYWRVSYEQHFRALVKIRDPFELYGEDIRAALQAGGQ